MVVVAWLGLALRYLCCEEKGDPLAAAAALHWNAHDDDDDD